MSARWDVLGFGAVAVDDLLYVDHYPPPDSKQPIRDQQRQGGGLTGTALVAAARLGARAAYAGVLGDDELSRFTLQAFEREGVDCTPVLRYADARPIHSFIIVDRTTGQRSILFSMAGVTPRPPEAMTETLIAACRVLFVDHTVVEGGLRAIAIAQAYGIPVVGDVERVESPGVVELVRRIDHLIVGLAMAGRLTGQADPALAARTLANAPYVHGTHPRACVVVTAGERGCWYSERGEPAQHVPAIQMPVIDTTGCGDVFHGAYAASLSQGADLRTAVVIASVAAGLKATQPGGRAGIPDRATVDRWLEEEQRRRAASDSRR